jgi:hypothetical protein
LSTGGQDLHPDFRACGLKSKKEGAYRYLVVHSVSMIASGGISAWLVYRYVGLKSVSRSWFNLVGALSL